MTVQADSPLQNKFVQEQPKEGGAAESVLERLNDVLYRRLFASAVPEEFTTIRVGTSCTDQLGHRCAVLIMTIDWVNFKCDRFSRNV